MSLPLVGWKRSTLLLVIAVLVTVPLLFEYGIQGLKHEKTNETMNWFSSLNVSRLHSQLEFYLPKSSNLGA
jgi:hypothetical protein